MTTIELRPRSVTEIVDAAFELLRRNYLALITISAVLQVPVLLLQIKLGPEVIDPIKFVDNLGSLMALGLADLIARSLADAAIIIGVSDSYLGRPVSVARSLGHLMVRFFPLVFALLIRFLASYIAAIAFLFPGAYVFVRLTVLPAVVVLEKVGVVGSIDRTWKLTEGRVWDTFLTIALASIVYWAVAAVFTLSVQALGAFVPFFAQPGVVMTAGRLAAVFVYPCVGVVTTLIYYDLRIRKEALDLELMTSALEPRAS